MILSCFEAYFTSIDWNIISSLSTLLMALLTLLTLLLNMKSLTQLKKQWDEEHRPIVQFSIVFREGNALLKISNIGNMTAKQVSLEFGDFFKKLIAKQLTERYCDLEKHQITIEPKSSKYFILAPEKGHDVVLYHRTKESVNREKIDKWYTEHYDDDITIFCRYNQKYNISETLRLSDYMCGNIVILDDEITAIETITNSIKQQNNIIREIKNRIK